MADFSKTFEIEDQRWFASASADFNPLHVDQQWASTHFPGALVVHGQHILLWTLDQVAARRPNDHFASIDATYLKPVVVGDRIEATVSEDGRIVRVSLRQEIIMVARIQRGEAGGRPGSSFVAGHPLATARARAAPELTGLNGSVALPDAAREISQRFPALASIIGTDRIIGLAAISTLVGMDCPGLRSLLSRTSITIAEPDDKAALGFRVRKFHEAMSLVEIDFAGLGISGTVMAFTTPPPPAPPSDEAVLAMVSRREFRDQHPLIIGASSGLGAATARLLAAGGADPVLTWNHSAIDETATAIRRLGASGRSLQLDATAPSRGLAELAASGWSGEQIYYFATPRIFRRRLEAYDKQDFRDFTAVFVDGFYETIRGLASVYRRQLTVFYPSSEAVDVPASDLFEYALAKLAGEQICARMEKTISGLKIVVNRLPRIATRQTETFLKVKADTPEAIMLSIIRNVQAPR